MNKEQYLEKLDQLLSSLPYKERRDIMYDYEAHFEEGLKEGLSESDIAKSLNTPEIVASKYIRIKKPSASEDIESNTTSTNTPLSDKASTKKITYAKPMEEKSKYIKTPSSNRPVVTKQSNHPLTMLLIAFALLLLFSFLIGPYIAFWSVVIVFFAISIIFLFSGFTIFISSILSMPLAIFNIPIELLDHPVFLLSGSVFLISLGGLFLILTYFFGKGLAYMGFYYIKWNIKLIRGY